jgi:hypothetical protein
VENLDQALSKKEALVSAYRAGLRIAGISGVRVFNLEEPAGGMALCALNAEISTKLDTTLR